MLGGEEQDGDGLCFGTFFFITLQLARENRGLTTKGTFVLEKNELNTINKNTQTRLPVQPVMEPSDGQKRETQSSDTSDGLPISD